MHAGVETIAFRTPTLPPATHTNTWVVGEGRLTVVDPASPYEDEQHRLLAALRRRLNRGEHVERLLLTHHHHDHVSGAIQLQTDLRDLGHDVPIAAHHATADLLTDTVPVDERLAANAELACGGVTLHALHTPGHAPGHLVFHNRADGWMIAGDMVAGIGTILLHPSEGDLADYLASLEAMTQAAPTVLLPSHGPDLTEPTALLTMYVAHRHMRTQQIAEALQTGGVQSPRELAQQVYPELEPRFLGIAALQITTHLYWLENHGLAAPAEGGLWRRS